MTSSAQGPGEEEPSPEPRPSPSPHPQNLQVRLGIETTLCGRSIFKLMTEPWSITHISWFCSVLREVTIRLWRNPRQCPWKVNFISFDTFSQSSQFALLLKRREFLLEVKRGNHTQVQIEMVEFIALLFPFASKLKIWPFHVPFVNRTAKKFTKGHNEPQSYCFAH